jgi:hypothetical protein
MSFLQDDLRGVLYGPIIPPKEEVVMKTVATGGDGSPSVTMMVYLLAWKSARGERVQGNLVCCERYITRFELA